MYKYLVAILYGSKNKKIIVCLSKMNERAQSVSKAKPALSDKFYSDSGEEEEDEEDEEEGSDSSSEDSSSSSEG